MYKVEIQLQILAQHTRAVPVLHWSTSRFD